MDKCTPGRFGGHKKNAAIEFGPSDAGIKKPLVDDHTPTMVNKAIDNRPHLGAGGH